MRITRTLFASAAITAALAISAPTANAMTVAELSASEDGGYGNDEHEHDKSKHSESDEDKEKKDSWSKDKPKGGVHAGGGALALNTAGDNGYGKDEDEDESKHGKYDKEKDSWSKDKPKGGVHAAAAAWLSQVTAWPQAPYCCSVASGPACTCCGAATRRTSARSDQVPRHSLRCRGHHPPSEGNGGRDLAFRRLPCLTPPFTKGTVPWSPRSRPSPSPSPRPEPFATLCWRPR